VVGVHGGEVFGAAARRAVAGADVLVGSDRHLAALGAPAPHTERVALAGALAPVLETVAERAAAGRRVCVVSSGDPGFFGIVRLLAGRLGPDRLVVHPAPSSVALAAARIGTPWDDAVVVSAHGRPLPEAAAEAVRHAKVAVLTSPSSPPEALGRALRAAGARFSDVAVCSHLGEDGERVVRTDLDGLATGCFPGLSVVVLQASDEPVPAPSLCWGRPAGVFDHRAGMVTKPEVRIVALARLALPRHGVLWDVGAGSGSVAVEAALLAPGLRVLAVERDPQEAARVRRNATALGATVEVVEGEAPAALGDLPPPDRVFVGGGGLAVLDAALDRLRPGGQVVATFASLERAATAHARLGHLVQLAVSVGRSLPDGDVRLEAGNPVFVAWGPGGGEP
jgi:precorrin-6Y C5,15-methyltransferase (decarboxylating)